MNDPHVPRKRPDAASGDHTAVQLVRVIDQSVEQLWATIESLERLQPRNLEQFRVSLFGSSRVDPGQPLYAEVRKLAELLSAAGCEIITGGGAGLMQAANEGASHGGITGPAEGGGLPVRLVSGSEIRPFVERIYRHRTFFSRLHHFVRLSSAFVVFPGGLGSTLEAMMIWQLLQVHHLPPTPFILYGEHWDGLLAWMKDTIIAGGFANPEDLQIPLRVDSVDEAAAVILTALREFRAARGA
ncbi:MAG: LOG family protein [Acidobacteria bacterium]|nr:LOG family protein [Acidobacteriota bacterium]